MRNWNYLGTGLVAALLMAGLVTAQQPVISSINNGKLTFVNVTSNTEYRIQWSGTSTTNATNDLYSRVEYVTPTSTAPVTLEVPLFFNVATTNALSNDIVRASELPLALKLGTNAKANVEWSEQPGGPWFASWGAVLQQSPTGTVVSVPTPRFYRISFVNCPSNYHACATWYDATDPAADHTNKFFCCSYQRPCMKIKVGQPVIFSGSFSDYGLRTACQECEAMTNVDTFGFGTATFTFDKPGYYGYYAQNFSTSNGESMAGNIWVVP